MGIIPNVAWRRLREGDAALGFGATHIRSPCVAHMARAAGYHWITIDLEHGVWTLEDAAQLCMMASCAGISPIVRVGAGAYSDGTRLLDNGAQGVMVADVRSADQARRIVQAFRYPPQGRRSWGANAFPFGYWPPAVGEAMRLVNEELLLAAMIESADAIEAIDEIAATPGIDVLFVGASDLSTDLGSPGRFGDPVTQAAIERVAEACLRQGKVMGLGGIYDATWLPHYVRRGARFIAGGNDHGFVLAGASERARQLEQVLAEARK